MFGGAAQGSEEPARGHQDWAQAPPPAAATPQAAAPSAPTATQATRSDFITATLPAKPTSGQPIFPLFGGDELPLIGLTFADKKWESKGKIIQSLKELPNEFWKLKEPIPGWNYR